MMPDEPINFDFTPESPVDAGAQGGALAGGATTAGSPTSTTNAARAGAAAPLPPIPDFRSACYPFAMTSRFQAQAVIPAPKASPRQRLLYGILAALVSVIVAIGIVAVFRLTDHGAGR